MVRCGGSGCGWRKTAAAGLLAAGLAAACFPVAGCVPTTTDLIEMRSQTSAKVALRDQRKVLEYLGAGSALSTSKGDESATPPQETRRAVWRIEAMRTLCSLDASFDFARTEPETHARLERFLYEEYAQPGSDGDSRRVQAWCIHCLGQLDPPGLAAMLVDVLEENPLAEDPGYLISLAALDALQLKAAALTADTALRRRVLRKLATISADVRRGRLSAERREQLAPVTAWFERNCKGYADVVHLLPGGATDRADDPTLLEILKWNYRRLAVGEHRSDRPGTAELLRTNIDRLVLLAWDRGNAVRAAARMILAEFAPLDLFGTLADRIASDAPLTGEDFEHFANLLGRVDLLLAGDDDPAAVAAVRRRRPRAIARALERISEAPVKSREVLYARLLVHDRKALTAGLVAAGAGVLAEPPEKVLQHLRYLGLLLPAGAGGGPNADARIAAAIGPFLRRPSTPIRRRVVSLLLERHALELARHAAAAMKTVAREPAAPAACLVDAYLTCLGRIESAPQPPGRQRLAAILAADPFELLTSAVAHSQYEIRSKVAAYLSPRDPGLLVSLLAENIAGRLGRGEAVNAKEMALLGDVVQATRKRLAGEVFERAVAALLEGATGADEQRSVLCARYVIELGRGDALARRAPLSPPVRAMLKLHAAAVERGKMQ